MIYDRDSFYSSLHVIIGADFLGAVDANAPTENSAVGALYPEEFGPKIPI